MHSHDIAWAAGLFEGEGCITTAGKNQKSRALKLQMTDRDVVERFQQIVGSGPVLFMDTPTNKKRYIHLLIWQIAQRKEVTRILDMFLPFLETVEPTKHLMCWITTN